MDLILWRHAEAEDGSPDHARALTDKGRQQAALMAGWLIARLPQDVRILVSPARRAQQTAQALGIAFETCDALAPRSNAAEALAAANWPDAEDVVLLVGHQPTLGQLAALLLSGRSADWAFRKSAVWWFSNRAHEGENQIMLEAALAPNMLKKSEP
jgi:phosphohistidine phosphatase